MLYFIVCEDEMFFVQQICMIIDKVMMTFKLEYTVLTFLEINQTFVEQVNQIKNKIFIFDIEIGNINAIDIARRIRYTDEKTDIIFITAYEDKYANDLLKKMWKITAFISKLDNYQEILYKVLVRCLNKSKKNNLQVTSNYLHYSISLETILYVCKDTETRETIIVTDNELISTFKTLKSIHSTLPNHFELLLRKYIINTNRIKARNNKCIIFDNNTKLILSSYKVKN